MTLTDHNCIHEEMKSGRLNTVVFTAVQFSILHRHVCYVRT
jgi:hypothetical protein